jgi:Icc-related predicted phosphoesterase
MEPMATRRVDRLLCAANPAGSAAVVESLLEATTEADVQALALVGDLSGVGDESLRSVLRVLARGSLPTFWVPGPGDAPAEAYLREAANIEIVAGHVRGVHGGLAFAPGHILFAGFGGDVSDDPNQSRDELERLLYPRWEPEYRLKLIHELDEHELVLVFSTPPAHKGLGTGGSEVLAELVSTHRPRVVVCGGPRGTEMLGRSLVVSPGNLSDGDYAIADLHRREATLEQLAARASAP